MPKQRALSFNQCLDQMRNGRGADAEHGFFSLQPRASEFVEELIEAFKTESWHPMQCWLLELIGDAKSERAFALLCDQALGEDESLRDWAVRGLRALDTKEARRF